MKAVKFEEGRVCKLKRKTALARREPKREMRARKSDASPKERFTVEQNKQLRDTRTQKQANSCGLSTLENSSIDERDREPARSTRLSPSE